MIKSVKWKNSTLPILWPAAPQTPKTPPVTQFFRGLAAWPQKPRNQSHIGRYMFHHVGWKSPQRMALEVESNHE